MRPEDPAVSPAPGTEKQPAKPVLTAKQAKRANQTVKGMFISVLLTVAVFVPVYLLNPGSKPETYQRNIDVPGVALQAEPAAGYLPLAPALPDGWSANYARWNSGGSAQVPAWEAGYLTPGGSHIGLTQTDKGNPTWVAQVTDEAPVTGQRRIGGSDWELRDRGTGSTSLVLEEDGYTVILEGAAGLAEFDVLGAAVINELHGK